MELNIIIAGVGGQGTLLASKILGNYAMVMGYDCKLSEVHGMAQRGGSVVSYVKFGKKIFSPTVSEGEADILIAFEQLEALRYAYNLKKGGCLVLNDQKIMPLPVITGAQKYPENILETLQNQEFNFYPLAALETAIACGNEKAVNTVMIGYAAKIIGLDFDALKKALELSVPQKLLEINQKALEAGYATLSK